MGIGLNVRRMRDKFLGSFTTTYSLRPVGDDYGSVFRQYPELWKVFVADADMPGRYKLVAERGSRPAGAPPHRFLHACYTIPVHFLWCQCLLQVRNGITPCQKGEVLSLFCMPPGLLDEAEALAAVCRCHQVRRYFLLLSATPSYEYGQQLAWLSSPTMDIITGHMPQVVLRGVRSESRARVFG